MKFNEKLQKLRKEKNYSQEILANKLEVSRQSVSKWETGSARPDMEKIIQMCEVLDCKLDDLLDDGIISSDTKAVVNTKHFQEYFQNFLHGLTKISNMLSAMSFKDKIVMIIEMIIVMSVYMIFVFGTIFLLSEIGNNLFSLLPHSAYHVLSEIFNLIFEIIFTIIGIIVFIHIFNIRYLDYYITVEDKEVIHKTIEEPIEKTKEKNYIPLKKEKIIIRDPKHSSNRFLKFLAKICIFFIKLFLSFIGLITIISFLVSFTAVGYSIFNINNGMVFILLAFVFLGIAGALYPIIDIIYNFIFNKTIAFKRLLLILVSSLVISGISLGLSIGLIGTYETTNFSDVIDLESTTETISYTENDKVYFMFYNFDLNYIVDDNLENDIATIKISYPYYYQYDSYKYNNNSYKFYLKENKLTIYKLVMQNFKNKLILNYDYSQINVSITANNKTINLMKNNFKY
jgi:transcriptional regulator with XRE-family HTH domain